MVSFWYMAQRGFAGYSKPTQYAIVWGSVLAILISIFLFLSSSGMLPSRGGDGEYDVIIAPGQEKNIPEAYLDQLPSRNQ
jgi:hypothetical protein